MSLQPDDASPLAPGPRRALQPGGGPRAAAPRGSARRGRAGAAALLVLCAAAAAAGHPLAPSLLELRAAEGTTWQVRWKTPLRGPAGLRPAPVLPAHCRETEPPRGRRDGAAWLETWTVDCGPAGLAGARVGVAGLGPDAGGVIVRMETPDGRRTGGLLSAGAPDLRVPEGGARLRRFAGHLRLGAAHLALGWDHVLFVLGLLALVRGRRMLLWTVTAFTAGHSVTLSLAVLGFVNARAAWVEVAIAASLLVVGAEVGRAADGRPGALGRRPAAMAGAFGLLHGMGFAGALLEAGLPPNEIPLALFGFNLGIEVGQLALIVLALAVARALAPVLRRPPARAPRLAAAYGIGALAAFWMLERAAFALGPR